MSDKLTSGFLWFDPEEQKGSPTTDEEKYQKLARWAREARGHNPLAFDALTDWILDDSEWAEDKLAQNERILMRGVIARFKSQNARLRAHLKDIGPSAAVNQAVFRALDEFDNELSGVTRSGGLRGAVSKMFTDFKAMRDRGLRVLIAGGKTGPEGADSAEAYGYINILKECDAAVQWALFMPGVVEKLQQGFRVERIGYIRMPAMRFIGKELGESGDPGTDEGLRQLFGVLDAMGDHSSGLDFDVLFQHHYGRGVDVERRHGFWGRFMAAGAPVPEGFVFFDLGPQFDDFPAAGPPFVSQFAFAVFSGDKEAMHKKEGYDVGAMYDVTRNIMLGQGVGIPYPEKYWTAEVFPNGYAGGSTAYMFSAVIGDKQENVYSHVRELLEK